MRENGVSLWMNGKGVEKREGGRERERERERE